MHRDFHAFETLLAKRADDDVQLHHQADGHKEEVEKEHPRAEDPTDPPLTGRNGGDENGKHKKEEHGGADESTAADRRRSRAVNERVQEPRQREPLMWEHTTRETDTKHASLPGTSSLPFDSYITSAHKVLPHSDVKYVAGHSAGDEQVRQASPDQAATGDQVRNRRPHSQNGQTHDRPRDAQSFTHLHAERDTSC